MPVTQIGDGTVRYETVVLCGVRLSLAAAACVEETGVDVAHDVERMRGDLRHLPAVDAIEAFAVECLSGADPDREQGWRDYVEAIVDAAGAVSL